MVFVLVGDIRDDFIQATWIDGEGRVRALPTERATTRELKIDEMRRSLLRVLGEVRHGQGRREMYQQMNVILNAAKRQHFGL